MDSLFDKISSIDTLKTAWKHVLQKNSRGGLDSVQPLDIEQDIDKKLIALSSELQHGTYVPVPYAKGAIPKFNKNNEWRKLSLPSVIDKIVQQAFVIVMEPAFEKEFKDCSYAYRKGKGPVKAIKHLEFYLDTTDVNWVASLDIDNFFDTMNHQRLLEILKKKINEVKIINLVSLYLKAGSISKKGEWDEPDEGISQGSVISPLLSNIYLHALDEFAVENEFKYIRYSDNLIIVDQNRDSIHTAFEQINAFIENQLFLKLNNNPYPFKKINNGFVFLGIYFKQKIRRICNSKETKIFKELNYLTDRAHQHDIDHFIIQLNSSIRGKKQYYGFINATSQFEQFDLHLIKRLKFLIGYFIQKNMLTAKKEVVELLMRIVFFVKRQPSDKEALCFLHAFQTNKPTLVYDMVEEFRFISGY